MHVALALKKQLMLFHNIFNVHEFELYDRGIIIEPTTGCDCYFGNTCSRDRSCMYDVSVKDVLTKSLRTNNPHNVVKATIQGLMSLKGLKYYTAVRGKNLKPDAS